MIYKKIGKTVIVTDDEKVYTFVGEKQQREDLTTLIDKLDTMKSKAAITTFKKKQIIPLLTLKVEDEKKAAAKKVAALKGEKKLEKKKAAASKTTLTKSESKEMVLASSIEDDLQLEKENQDLKEKNSALEAEKKRMAEALEKTKEIKPAPSNTGIGKKGEH